MKIKFVYKIFPALILSIPWLKKWGFSFAFIVLMPTKLTDEEYNKLLTHELIHVKQFYRTFGLSEILYRVSRNYRWRAEIEAYATEIETKTMFIQVIIIARIITQNYNTGKTIEQTKKALLQEIGQLNYNFKK